MEDYCIIGFDYAGRVKAFSGGYDREGAAGVAKYYRSIKERGMRRFKSVRVMLHKDWCSLEPC